MEENNGNPILDYAKKHGISVTDSDSYDKAMRAAHIEKYPQVGFDEFKTRFVEKYGDPYADSKKKESTAVSSPVSEPSTSPVSGGSTDFLKQHPQLAESVNPMPSVPQEQTKPDTQQPYKSVMNWSKPITIAEVANTNPQRQQLSFDNQVTKEKITKTAKDELSVEREGKLRGVSPTVANADMVNHLTNEKPLTHYDADFIKQNFSDLSESYQKDIAAYLAKTNAESPELWQKTVSQVGQMGLSNKQKVGLLEKATGNRFLQAKKDLDILEARQFEKHFTGKGVDTDLAYAEKVVDNYNAAKTDAKELVKQYPDVLKERKEIKSKYEGLDIKEEDGILTKGKKLIAGQILYPIWNTVPDMVKSAMSFGKGASDLVKSAAGVDVNKYGESDRLMEGIGSFLDNFKGVTPKEYGGEDDWTGKEKGLFTLTGFVPKVASTVAQMYMFGMAGKTSTGSSSAASALFGTMQQYDQYAEAAKELGLPDDKAFLYAAPMSLVQSMLENVSSLGEKALAEARVKGMTEAAKFLKDNPAGNLDKHLLKFFGQQYGEEFTQLAAEKVANMGANYLIGQDKFDTGISKNELAETATLTTAINFLLKGKVGKEFNRSYKDAVDLFQSNTEQSTQYINDLYRNGNITRQQAQAMQDVVDDGMKSKIVQDYETKTQAADAQPTAENTQQESQSTAAEAPKAEAETVIPEEKQVKEISEEELINENTSNEKTSLVQSDINDSQQSSSSQKGNEEASANAKDVANIELSNQTATKTVANDPTPDAAPQTALAEDARSPEAENKTVQAKVEPVLPLPSDEQPSDKVEEPSATPINGDAATVQADKPQEVKEQKIKISDTQGAIIVPSAKGFEVAIVEKNKEGKGVVTEDKIFKTEQEALDFVESKKPKPQPTKVETPSVSEPKNELTVDEFKQSGYEIPSMLEKRGVVGLRPIKNSNNKFDVVLKNGQVIKDVVINKSVKSDDPVIDNKKLLTNSDKVQISYNGQVSDVDMPFEKAAMRVRDNLKTGEKGYVKDKNNKVYEISTESKKAVLVEHEFDTPSVKADETPVAAKPEPVQPIAKEQKVTPSVSEQSNPQETTKETPAETLQDAKPSQTPHQKKLQNEINIVDKQIESAKKSPTGADKVKILEKKKAELGRKMEIANDIANFGKAAVGRSRTMSKGLQTITDRLKKVFPNIDVVTDPAIIANLQAASGTPFNAFYADGTVYIDTAYAHPMDVIHEYGHLWMELCKKGALPYWTRAKKLIEKTDYYKQISTDPNYAAKPETWHEEAIMLAFEDAQEKLNNSVFARAKLALNQIYDAVKTKLGLPPSLNITKFTLGDLVKAVVKDVNRTTPLTSASSVDVSNYIKNKPVTITVDNSILSDKNPNGLLHKLSKNYNEYVKLYNGLGRSFYTQILGGGKARVEAVLKDVELTHKRFIERIDQLKPTMSDNDFKDLLGLCGDVFAGDRVVTDLPVSLQEPMQRFISTRDKFTKYILRDLEASGKVVLNHDLGLLLTKNWQTQERIDGEMSDINKQYDTLFKKARALDEAAGSAEIQRISEEQDSRANDLQTKILLTKLAEAQEKFKAIAARKGNLSVNEQDLLNKIRDLEEMIAKVNASGASSAKTALQEQYQKQIVALKKAVEAQIVRNEQANSNRDTNAPIRAEIEASRQREIKAATSKANKESLQIEKDTNKAISSIDKQSELKKKGIIAVSDTKEKAAIRAFEAKKKNYQKQIAETKSDNKKNVAEFNRVEESHKKAIELINESKTKQLEKIEQERIDKVKAIEDKALLRKGKISDATIEKLQNINGKYDDRLLNYPDNHIAKDLTGLDPLTENIQELQKELKELLETNAPDSSQKSVLKKIEKTRQLEIKAKTQDLRSNDTVEIEHHYNEADNTFDLKLRQRNGSVEVVKGISEKDVQLMLGESTANKMSHAKKGYIDTDNLLLNNKAYERIRSNEGKYVARSYMMYDIEDFHKNLKKYIGEDVYNAGIAHIQNTYSDPQIKGIRPAIFNGKTYYILTNKYGVDSERKPIQNMKSFMDNLDVTSAERAAFDRYEEKGNFEKPFEFQTSKGRFTNHGIEFRLSEDEVLDILKDITEAKSLDNIPDRSGKGLDLNALKKKGDIDEAVRGLMGEYTDPRVNIVKTTMRVAALATKSELHRNWLNAGLENGWLSVKPNAKTGMTKEVTAAELRSLANFSTKTLGNEDNNQSKKVETVYTTEEIYDAMFGNDAMTEKGSFVNGLMKASQRVKMNMTVYSQGSQTRNIDSGFIKLIETGNLGAFRYFANATRVASQELPENMLRKGKKLGDVGRRLLPSMLNIPYSLFRAVDNTVGKKQFGNTGNETLLEEALEMREMGLLGSNIDTGSVRQYIDLNGNANPVTGEVGFFSEVDATAAAMYQLPDAVAKIMQYKAEKAHLLKRGVPIEQAKIQAAEKTRMMQPTYGDAPKWIRKLSATPWFGNFIMFKAETYRTYFNILSVAGQEIKQGDAKGYARIASLMTSFAARHAAYGYLTSFLTGMDKDDEEAVMALEPDYGKNSKYIFTKFDRTTKELYKIDMSYIDPLGDPIKVGNAILRGKDFSEKIKNGLDAISDGFTDPDLFVGGMVQAALNRDFDNDDIVNPQKDFFTSTVWTMDFLANTMLPKVLNEHSNVATAAFTDQKDNVYALTVPNEMIGLGLGVKVKGKKLQNQYDKKVGEMIDRWEQAKNIYEKPNFAKSPIGRLALSGAYKNEDERKESLKKDAQKAMNEVFNDLLKIYRAKERLGLEESYHFKKNTSYLLTQLQQGELTEYKLYEGEGK